MTLKKPTGEVNWAVVGPTLAAAVLGLTGTGGAVGGQVAANAQMAELRLKVTTLEAGAQDRETRIRAVETNLVVRARLFAVFKLCLSNRGAEGDVPKGWRH